MSHAGCAGVSMSRAAAQRARLRGTSGFVTAKSRAVGPRARSYGPPTPSRLGTRARTWPRPDLAR
eukprot:10750767-Alexandrium_andersonii.AAC.1